MRWLGWPGCIRRRPANGDGTGAVGGAAHIAAGAAQMMAAAGRRSASSGPGRGVGRPGGRRAPVSMGHGQPQSLAAGPTPQPAGQGSGTSRTCPSWGTVELVDSDTARHMSAPAPTRRRNDAHFSLTEIPLCQGSPDLPPHFKQFLMPPCRGANIGETSRS